MRTSNWLGIGLVAALVGAAGYAAGWFDSAPKEPPAGAVTIGMGDGPCQRGTVAVRLTNQDHKQTLKSVHINVRAYEDGHSTDRVISGGSVRHDFVVAPDSSVDACVPVIMDSHESVTIKLEASLPEFYKSGEFIPPPLPGPAPRASGRR